MEEQEANQGDHLPTKPIKDYHSNVDTSRAFSSVREAVAIFGQRILPPGDTQTQNPKPRSPAPRPNISQSASSLSSSSKQFSFPCSPQDPREEFLSVVKKLEAELKETRTELRLLKERESETEVALATLNAELHKNMSKLARAEADAAGKSAAAAAMAKTVSCEMRSDRSNEREIGPVTREGERRKELMGKMESKYPTLAQILDRNKGDREGCFGKKERKKKPIVPLVGDFWFRKKGFSDDISGPLYTQRAL